MHHYPDSGGQYAPFDTFRVLHVIKPAPIVGSTPVQVSRRAKIRSSIPTAIHLHNHGSLVSPAFEQKRRPNQPCRNFSLSSGVIGSKRSDIRLRDLELE